MRAQKDKFGGRKKKKLEEEDRTKVSRRRAASAGVGTHAAEQGAGAQAGPHGGGGAGAGVGRGAQQRGAGGGILPGLGAPRPGPALGPAGPAPAPPHLPKPLAAFRPRSGPPGTHLGQVRLAGHVGKVGGARIPSAAPAAQPDSTLTGARGLVPSEDLEIPRPGFEFQRGHSVNSQHCFPRTGQKPRVGHS